MFLPAPIVYGKLFDNTCLTWKTVCGSKGACQLYDIENMRLTLKSVDGLLAAISFLITIPAFIISQKDPDETEKEKEIDVEVVESGKETPQTIAMFSMKEK